MSWADVRHHYQDRDDDPEPTADIEVITHACPGCGKPVRGPIDADGDDLCCSRECIETVCQRMDDELVALRTAELAEFEASLVDTACPECGQIFRAPPESAADLCCGKECQEKQVARLYADVPPASGDEIPW